MADEPNWANYYSGLIIRIGNHVQSFEDSQVWFSGNDPFTASELGDLLPEEYPTYFDESEVIRSLLFADDVIVVGHTDFDIKAI